MALKIVENIPGSTPTEPKTQTDSFEVRAKPVPTVYIPVTPKKESTISNPTNPLILDAFNQVSTYLSDTVYEKEKEVESILALLISKQHGFMLGAPGVGKSYLISQVLQCFTDAQMFEKLMMATTTPEELFGPISL